MENRTELYEPVVNFREQRPQILVSTIEHDALYEKAFYNGEEKSQSEYAQNTTTWD